jgi:hypothetical protein
MRQIFILTMTLLFASANEDIFSDVKLKLAQLESGNKKETVNSRGFLGKYQLGAMSLIEAGFVKLENYRALTYTQRTETRKAKVMWKDGYTLTKFLDDSRYGNG